MNHEANEQLFACARMALANFRNAGKAAFLPGGPGGLTPPGMGQPGMAPGMMSPGMPPPQAGGGVAPPGGAGPPPPPPLIQPAGSMAPLPPGAASPPGPPPDAGGGAPPPDQGAAPPPPPPPTPPSPAAGGGLDPEVLRSLIREELAGGKGKGQGAGKKITPEEAFRKTDQVQKLLVNLHNVLNIPMPSNILNDPVETQDQQPQGNGGGGGSEKKTAYDSSIKPLEPMRPAQPPPKQASAAFDAGQTAAALQMLLQRFKEANRLAV